MLLRTTFIWLLLLAAQVRADVPLAPSLLNPLSAAEAWNVIRLASTNVERLIKEKRPLEVPPQISLLSPALRVLAKSPVKEGKEAMLDAQTTAAFKMVNLIAKEAMAENNSALDGLHTNLRSALTELASGFEPALIEGELYHCPQHTDFISPQPAQNCTRCAQRLQARRIPYSFIHARPETPTIPHEHALRSPTTNAQAQPCRWFARFERGPLAHAHPTRPSASPWSRIRASFGGTQRNTW